jgi:ABC-type multidrug transport system ATPase subunit
MITESPVILLDEPTVKVDVPTRREMHTIIKEELCKKMGSTVLFTTHIMEEAERLCDRVAILNEGRIAEIGTPDQIKERMGEERFEDAFLKALEATKTSGTSGAGQPNEPYEVG